MHTWPNELSHKRGDSMSNSREGWCDPCSINKGAIQIHAVFQLALSCACKKRGGIQNRDQDDSTTHLLNINLPQQVLQYDRSFVFVAVIGSERNEPFAVFCFRPDKDRQRHQVIAPNTVVLQRDPIITTPRGIQVKLIRSNNCAFHCSLLSL